MIILIIGQSVHGGRGRLPAQHDAPVRLRQLGGHPHGNPQGMHAYGRDIHRVCYTYTAVFVFFQGSLWKLPPKPCSCMQCWTLFLSDGSFQELTAHTYYTYMHTCIKNDRTSRLLRRWWWESSAYLTPHGFITTVAVDLLLTRLRERWRVWRCP